MAKARKAKKRGVTAAEARMAIEAEIERIEGTLGVPVDLGATYRYYYAHGLRYALHALGDARKVVRRG